jgi:hypothetical protein
MSSHDETPNIINSTRFSECTVRCIEEVTPRNGGAGSIIVSGNFDRKGSESIAAMLPARTAEYATGMPGQLNTLTFRQVQPASLEGESILLQQKLREAGLIEGKGTRTYQRPEPETGSDWVSSSRGNEGPRRFFPRPVGPNSIT